MRDDVALRPTVLRILRVTADDLGYSAGITDAIIQCAREGIVTHASLLTVGIDCSRAAALAREIPTLRVGIHLALTEFRPLLPVGRIASLIGADGRLRPVGHLMQQTLMGRCDSRHVEAEWRAQIEGAIDAGIAPSHLDSHHHVHVLPPLRRVAVQLGREYGIQWLRRPVEWPPSSAKAAMVGAVAALGEWPLPAGDAFRGFGLYGKSDPIEAFCRMLARLPPGRTEVMVHPGYVADTALTSGFDWARQRRRDAGLCLSALVATELERQYISLDRPARDGVH